MPDAIAHRRRGENTGLDFTPGKKDYVMPRTAA